MKDLENSRLDRKNVLNNKYAVEILEKDLDFKGYLYNSEICFLKEDVVKIFEADVRTIERIIESNYEELVENGYEILKGKKLEDFKKFVTGQNAGNKINQLGIFRFRTILDIAMLLQNNDTAKYIRNRILDIVIDVLAEKTGGSTKYINQKDPDFLPIAVGEIQNRKKFTDALRDFVDVGNYKYGYFTNLIYECLFKENAQEYKNILKLDKKNTVRATLYSEVLVEISSYEAGIAYEIEQKFNTDKVKLSKEDVEKIIYDMFNHPKEQPRIQNIRTKMASRDLNFRDALHKKLEKYIKEVPTEEYDKFLNDQIKIIAEELEENKDVFERLKDK